MFVAMNRFRIAPGREPEFEAVWTGRNSHLEDVPGFRSFHLLRGPRTAEQSLYCSHSIWETQPEAFDRAVERFISSGTAPRGGTQPRR